MKSWKTGARLAAGFGAVCIILAIAVGVALWESRKIEQDVDAISRLHLPLTLATMEVSADLNGSLAALRGFMLTNDPQLRQERAAAWAALDKVTGQVDQLLAEQKNGGDTAARWAEIKPLLTRLHQVQDKVEEAAGRGEREQATALLRGEALPLVRQLQTILRGANHGDGLRAEQQKALLKSSAAALANIVEMNRILLALLVAGILLAIGIAFMITRDIAPPLARLAQAIKRIAAGASDVVIEGSGRRDEIGEIASAAIELQKVTVIAAQAETEMIAVSPHNYNSTLLSLSATVHASACMPNFTITEYFVPFEEFSQRVSPQALKPVNGYIEIPELPGLGLDIDEQVLRAMPAKPYPTRSLRHSEDDTAATF